MIDRSLIFCVTVAVFAVSPADRRQSGPLVYQLVEELPAGTFVADVRRDSNLTHIDTSESASTVTYTLLTASAHFQVDPDTGILKTLDVIDRDVLCPGQASCQLSVDVVVRPDLGGVYFQKVTVDIIDLNDNSPTFPHSHSTVYVSEATLPGQLLFPVQAAYDVDSPRYGVVGYRLVEGSAATSNTFQLTVDNTAAGGFDVRVVLRQPLDRERRDFYQLQVTLNLCQLKTLLFEQSFS